MIKFFFVEVQQTYRNTRNLVTGMEYTKLSINHI